MKFLKLFETFIEEPKFFRFSREDVLGEKEIIEFKPSQRHMVGPEIVNNVLLKFGFPDKRKCIHFMDDLAFDISYKGLYGEYMYQIEIDENSKLGWSFCFPINDWFYKGNPFYRERNNPALADLLKSEYGKLHYSENEDDLLKMAKFTFDYGVIGCGTIEDLKKSRFYQKQKLFVWTEDMVRVSKFVTEKRVREARPYKNQPILTKDDFERLGITPENIPQFYSSEWGQKIKRFRETADLNLKREEALRLLNQWSETQK